MRVVGAGLPRTGTTSLRAALESLLNAPVYHMHELAEHPEHGLSWRDAFRGDLTDWDAFLGGYAAGVDWPASCFWRELARAYPDAVVLLSYRSTPEEWFGSMDSTVLYGMRRRLTDGPASAWMASASAEEVAAANEMWDRMNRSLGADLDDPESIKAAYVRHLAAVRAEIPASRLVEWQPGDGWEPLCAALGVPVPDEPFPHRNSREEMHGRMREAGLRD